MENNKMKYLRKFNMIKESKLSAYTDVWVVIKYGDYDIGEVYLDKNEAELACVKRNEELKQFAYLKSKCVVKSLDDAIEIIKDSVRDDERMSRAEDEAGEDL